VAVEFGAMHDELEGGLEVVEKAVDVGEQDGQFATGRKELCHLDGGHEVAAVRAARCRSTCMVERTVVSNKIDVCGVCVSVAGRYGYATLTHPSRSSGDHPHRGLF